MTEGAAAAPRTRAGWAAAISDVERSSRPRGWEPRRARERWPMWLLSALIHAGLIVAWLNRAGPAAPPPIASPSARLSVRIVPLSPRPPGAVMQAPAAHPLPDQAADKLGPARKSAARPSRPLTAVTPPGNARPADVPPPPLPEATPAADPAPVSTQTLRDPSPQPAPAPSPSPGGSLWFEGPTLSKSARPGNTPSVREQVLNDPRANKLRPGPEASMARIAGAGQLQEEDLGDGRRRLRKGAACVDVHRTHIAQLNPFDSRLRDLNVAKPCD